VIASKFLSTQTSKPNGLVRFMDSFLKYLRTFYLKLLGKMLKLPLLVILLFFILLGMIAWVYPQVKQEFIPKEDRGAFFIMVNGPEGATHKYMEEYMTEIEQRLMDYVKEKQVSRLLVRTPRGFDGLSNFNDGMVIVLLEDWSKRRPATKIMAEIREQLSDLPGVRVFTVMRQGLGGRAQKPVQFVLGGATYEELAQWRDILFEKIAENNPGLIGLDSSYKETRPQIDFKINYDRAAELGVSIEEIGTTLETMMGGRRVTTFLDRGEEYDVIVEGERSQQRSFDQVKNIYVRSDRTGSMIPLSNLVTIREYGAAKSLTRYNRIRAITLEANLKEGYRLDEALTYLNGMVKKHLPETAIVDYKGQSRDFIKSGSSIVFVFLLGLVVVFLVLAAQFESYIHPFVIMLTVPLAMGGGLFGLYITDSSLNIYSQIALIILVGLSAKNGILIVEFANQLRDRGIEFSQALIQAAEIRFRPILMTGLTTIAGAIPLVVSSGAGSETRLVIGIVILSGVSAATIFTLFIVPVAYDLLARHTNSPGAVADKLVKEEAEQEKRENVKL
jgi:multidrug efflux pump